MSTPDDRTIQTRWIRVSPRFTLDTKDLKVTEYRDVESEPIKPTWSERVRALLGRSSDNFRDRSPRLRRQKIHTYDFNNNELPVKNIYGSYGRVVLRASGGPPAEAARCRGCPPSDPYDRGVGAAVQRHLYPGAFSAVFQGTCGYYVSPRIKYGTRSTVWRSAVWFCSSRFPKGRYRAIQYPYYENLSKPIEYNDDILWIDAPQYVAEIRKAFEEYYAKVGHDADLLQKFMKSWNDDWQMSLRVPGAGGTTSATVP